jgi:WD40 repeat protein
VGGSNKYASAKSLIDAHAWLQQEASCIPSQTQCQRQHHSDTVWLKINMNALLPTLFAACPTGHTKPVHSCAWNGMLKVLASGSSDRRVLLWNPFSCRTLGTLEGHTAPEVCLASNERDMQIISAAANNTVKVGGVLRQGLHDAVSASL